ncbi:hypothetical protein GCM10010517_13880 [Streptosporangium fragile]|uniref:Calcineurin-like phosphoesterase domain-containing protein n=1 Tax=Streptosporangium fragile TaxID=46186 RepID=A0ABP6I8Z7_9ACTN
MRFAVIGDIHGNFAEADAIIRRHAGPVDAIFSVGDAEPNRTEAESLGVGGPAKHRKVGDFPEFAGGLRTMSAPVYFIGGNHEPWPSLDAHGPGEWAPGFHFLGRSGVREIAGLRVAFLSGVYSRYFSEPDEPPAITPERLKEYGYFTRPHVKHLLSQARGKKIDLFITHDWPSGLSYRHHGKIPVGRDHIRALTDALAPQVHVCGHMHAPFRERIGVTDVICLSQVIYGVDAVAVLELTPDGVLKEGPLTDRSSQHMGGVPTGG